MSSENPSETSTRRPWQEGRVWISAAVWTVLAWGMTVLLDTAGVLDELDLKVMDTIAAISDRPTPDDGIVVVAIDTPSFQYLDTPWPWPRHVHADLLDAVSAAGAKAVIFDIVFDAGTPDDGRFADAMGGLETVALAAERSVLATPQGFIQTEAYPSETLSQAADGTGFAGLPLDRDGRLRRMPNNADALAYVAASEIGGFADVNNETRFIQFRADPFPRRVSYYQAIDPASRLPAGIFEGKTVLVGLALEANPTGSAVGDTVLLPAYTGNSGPQPGVVAQAFVLATALSGDALRPAPNWLSGLLAILSVVGSAALLFRMDRSVWQGLIGYTALFIAAFSTLWLLRSAGQVHAPGGILFGLFAAGIGQTAIVGGAALAARRRLAAGFSRYVSPEIMRSIMSAPEPPELGGEQREVSVIVTDLEGFTALMDDLDPADGAGLLRDYLDSLASVVLAHGGMIDQFIGDSVIALFNAPLNQADHAQRAIACVQALDRAAETFRTRQAAAGIELGTTRIGATTGLAVVGNFGARERFHYTAMGDVVNTASRLESANKELGTRVLVSETLFQAAGRPTGFGDPIDIELRGKSQPIPARPGK